MKKVITIELLTSFLILVFGYTAFSKLLTYSSFRYGLSQATFISLGAGVLAFAIPLAEPVTVLLLLFPATRLQELYASLVLLSVFTVYLLYMVLFVPHLPCSCGGVISNMSWQQHIVFNEAFIGLTVVGIRSFKNATSVVFS